MPRHLISDAHEWINEIPTVPIYYLAKPQPRERAWVYQRGKKTLLTARYYQSVTTTTHHFVSSSKCGGGGGRRGWWWVMHDILRSCQSELYGVNSRGTEQR